MDFFCKIMTHSYWKIINKLYDKLLHRYTSPSNMLYISCNWNKIKIFKCSVIIWATGFVSTTCVSIKVTVKVENMFLGCFCFLLFLFCLVSIFQLMLFSNYTRGYAPLMVCILYQDELLPNSPSDLRHLFSLAFALETFIHAIVMSAWPRVLVP